MHGLESTWLDRDSNTKLHYCSTVKPHYISAIGKRKFGDITSLVIDRGLDFCQLHVDIVRQSFALGGKKQYLHYTYR